MKKISLLLFVITALVTLGACTQSNQIYEFQTPEEQTVFQALSAATLLSSSTPELVVTSLGDSVIEDNELEEEIDEIQRYLWLMETYLGGDGALSVQTLVSDKEEFETMIQFTTKTLAGESIVYTLYYSEVVIEEDEAVAEENEPLAMNPNQDRPFRFQDPEDEAILSGLVGLFVVGETEIQLEGKLVQANQRNIMILRAYQDDQNHVAVRYMTGEDGDQAFFYTVVINGELISRTAVKVMVNGNRIRTSLQFIEGSVRGLYQFATTTIDNITYIHVIYRTIDGSTVETGNIWIQATYDEETNVTTYDYRVLPDQMNKNQSTGGKNPNRIPEEGMKETSRQHRHGNPGMNQQGQQRKF